MSKRGDDWIKFSMRVLRHIEDYTIPQYGDKGSDNLDKYTPDDCIKQVEKYLSRRGKNQRDGNDEMDILKAAHYLQVYWDKM
jgi:hypothetical protein